jgi:hypothetical protein
MSPLEKDIVFLGIWLVGAALSYIIARYSNLKKYKKWTIGDRSDALVAAIVLSYISLIIEIYFLFKNIYGDKKSNW